MSSFVSKAGNMRLGYLPGFSLMVIDRTVPIDEWNEMLAIARANDDPTSKVVLLWVRSGEITAEHRRAAAADHADNPRKPPLAIALITESILIRGALTAYNWLVRPAFPTRAWAPNELSQALVWLGTLSPFNQTEAAALIEKLKTPH